MKIEEKDGKLVIVDFNQTEAYKIACKVEKDGILFYEKLKGKVKKPEIIETLDFLISEEKKHLKYFEDCLYEAREKQEDYFEDDDLLNYLDFGVFEPYNSIDEMENILSDLDKALRLGIAVEKKSVKFYQLCQENVSSSDAKDGLGRIIKEEERHKELLENILKREE